MRALLLEDSPLDADLIIDSLNGDGWNSQVECVCTREKFLAALQKGGFDVILADYSLPGFNGMAALELAQERVPNIPFIFVSGYLGEDLAIETLKRGATDYVLKDRLERLRPAVERAIREVQERNRRRRIEKALKILSEASLLLSSLDYATTLAHVAQLAVPYFADFCVVDILEEDGTLRRVAVAHADPEREALVQQLLPYAPRHRSVHPADEILRQGKAMFIAQVPDTFIDANSQDEHHREVLLQLGVSSYMLVPLVSDAQTLGLMTFVISSSERAYDELDLSLSEDLARRCALAVDKARLHLKTLDALRARDEFLAVLSHELRSPLTSILGWVQILQESGLEEEMRLHGLQVIQRNTKAQIQLIQDLLEVSRIITGRLKLEMKSVSLANLVASVVDSMLPTAQAKGVALRFHNELHSQGGGADQIMGDEPRLQQVFWNLVSNAIKFTPARGSVELYLRASEGMVRVEVRDNGEGIEPDFLPYAFDRFRQANSSSTRKHGGLGLGLAIVRHITEMHGGTVQAQSEGVGKGSTFVVELPLRFQQLTHPQGDEDEQEWNQSAHASTGNREKGAALEGARLLLVEDGDDTRELIAAVLRRAGAQVTAVDSVQAAKAALADEVPDVVVSDIGMPGEDGYALIRYLKSWESKHNQHVPAIALTAYVSEPDQQRAIAEGFQLHLAKPIEPGLLVSSIAQITGRVLV